MEEANEHRLKEEEQRVHLLKAKVKEPLMWNEVAELRVLLLNQEQQWAMAQPPLSTDIITQLIQYMWAQGLVVASSNTLSHLPVGLPVEHILQQPFSFL